MCNDCMTKETLQRLLMMPFQLCATQQAVTEDGQLEGWLEPYHDVSPEEVRMLVQAGHFELATSTDGEIHLWPNYERFDDIPEKYEQLKWDAHAGIVLDLMPQSETEH